MDLNRESVKRPWRPLIKMDEAVKAKVEKCLTEECEFRTRRESCSFAAWQRFRHRRTQFQNCRLWFFLASLPFSQTGVIGGLTQIPP
jgi:hypothetical protein